MKNVERDPAKLFAPPAIQLERRADRTLYLKSPQELRPYSRCVGDWLVHWAAHAPARCFLAERARDRAWQALSYGKALETITRVGTWLLGQGLSVERPVVILSDNSVQHALLSLAAMHVGIPVVPVSSAYSLVSKDFGKLKTILQAVTPGLIFVAEIPPFRAALQAVAPFHSACIVAGEGHGELPGVHSWAELLQSRDERAVDRAFTAVNSESVAKILFTSGSTGFPKGVINTQRMLCANQQQILQIWPFAIARPVVVDWLPWSHTFGGNHNFNFVLRAGGTLYIDAGRPTPGQFGHTIANLKDISPSIYFNVPRGYDLLVSALRADEALRNNFFRRLQVIFFAAAALPQHLSDALEQLALDTTGEPVVIVSSWGSTETAPVAASCHFRAERASVIGLPVPGSELKLIPVGEKLEVRVRGPHVMPGYWRQPELTAQSFDEEGFYRIGDAMRFVDEHRPELGLYFAGRVSEDFKLTTGTWVNVGSLRVRAISALAPVAQDLVIAGEGRASIAILVFPNLVNCRRLCPDLPTDAPAEQVLASEAIRHLVSEGLRRLRREGIGSSNYATRALLMLEPPSIDAGEITDKGYINQRVVLATRAAQIDVLYCASPCDEVITIEP